MNLSTLESKKRYLFCKNVKGNISYFRANFLASYVFNKTTSLIYNKRDTKERGLELYTTVYHMDSRDIVAAESLVDIVVTINCVLPDDVLHIINEYW